MTTVRDGTDTRRMTRRGEAILHEVRWFLEHTTDNSYAVARALGLQRQSLERSMVTRYGATDLWARLTARDVSLDPEPWYSLEWLPESHPKRQRDVRRNAARRAAA